MAEAVTCRAIVCEQFGGPEVLKVGSKEVAPPGAGQIRVRMGAAGVNPSDTYIRLGPAGPYAGMPLLPTLPFTPGKDGAGIVEAVGDGVSKFSIGDRVYLSGSLTGTCSEFTLCTEQQAFPLPASVSMAQGSCMGVPGLTAYRALHQRCKAKAGEVVLVHGASGAVGLVAVQLAAAAGCVVIGTAGTDAGCKAVKDAGALAAFNHKEDGYLSKCAAAVPGGTGFDICLEMMANANLAADLGVMARYGRVGIIGSRAEPVAINPRAAMPKELDIKGVFASNATPEEVAEARRDLFILMENGSIKPIVGISLPLSEAGKAHVEVMAPSAGGAFGNIVLIVVDDL